MAVILFTARFNIRKFYNFPIQCNILIYYMDLRKRNSDCFLLQRNWMVFIRESLLHGTELAVKYIIQVNIHV